MPKVKRILQAASKQNQKVNIFGMIIILLVCAAATGSCAKKETAVKPKLYWLYVEKRVIDHTREGFVIQNVEGEENR